LKFRSLFLFFLYLSLLSTSAFAETSSGVTFEMLEPEVKSKDDKVLQLDWFKLVNEDEGAFKFRSFRNSESGKKSSVDNSPKPINKNSRVYIELKNFNYLHFRPVINIEENRIEAAATLTDLVDQLIGLDFTSLFQLVGNGNRQLLGVSNEQKDTECTIVPTEIKDYAFYWALSLNSIRHSVARGFDVQNSSSAINPAKDSKLISEEIGCVNKHLLNAKKIQMILGEDFLNRSSNRYDLLNPIHIEIEASANQFLSFAINTIEGKREFAGKFDAGTAVEVTVLANTQPTADPNYQPEKRASLSFLTQGSVPLKFHAGLTYSELRELETESIQTLAGDPIESLLVEGSETINLSLFASYPLDGSVDVANWCVTLGTDVTDTGENIYGGISYRFAKSWVVTAGAVFGDTVDVDTMSVSTMGIGSESEPRPVQIVREDRSFEPFIALSYVFF